MKNNKKIFKKLLPILLSIVMIIGLLTPLDINAAQVANPSSMNVGDYIAYGYTGGIQTFTAPYTGNYNLKVWGASGGNSTYNTTKYGGKGGFSSGFINLSRGQTIYIYVGGVGTSDNISTTGGWNGGGSIAANQTTFGAPGGGGTDIRLTSGTFNDTTSLLSRVVVAGGGGGANTRDQGYGNGNGGAGGGLSGSNGITENQTVAGLAIGYGYGTGGTQTSGGHCLMFSNGVLQPLTAEWDIAYAGRLGSGGIDCGQSGGGGGYYGGGNSSHGGAGGGSSYIGGVTQGVTVSGDQYMTSPTGTTTLGNLGNGYATITLSEVTSIKVTLDNQNANYIGTTNVTATVGSVLPSITVPTKVGYTFNGYYESVNGTGTQYYNSAGVSSITSAFATDTTLYASWTANTNTVYKVEHYQMNLDGLTYSLEDTMVYTGTSGETISPSVNIYQGFKAPSLQSKIINGDGTTLIKYYYERNQYDVIITKDSGIQTTAGSGTYYYGEEVSLSATAKNGYTFSGFSGDYTENTFIMPALNLTIEANTDINVYSIAYLLNGGVITNKASYTIEDTFSLTAPVKTGYAFIGWTGSNGTTPQMNITVSNETGDLSYIAHYEIAHTHTLGPWTMITSPTTTETGLMGKYCTIDGELIKTMVLPKLSGGSFVLGEYDDPNNTTDDSDDDTDVYAYQTSSYQVTIPKTLVADGRTGLLDYTIGVKGNLASTDYVLVQPETSFFMKSVNKEDILTTIHQSINTFSYAGGVRNNQSANALGSIAMADISAGKWAGIFTFIISSNVDIATPNSIASTVEDINNNPVIGTDAKQNQITDYKIIQD